MKALSLFWLWCLLAACSGKQPRQTAGLDVFNPVGIEARLNYRRQLQATPANANQTGAASVTDVPQDAGMEDAEAPGAGGDAGTALTRE